MEDPFTRLETSDQPDVGNTEDEDDEEIQEFLPSIFDLSESQSKFLKFTIVFCVGFILYCYIDTEFGENVDATLSKIFTDIHYILTIITEYDGDTPADKSESQTEFIEEMKTIVEKLTSTESNLAFVNRSLVNFMYEEEHERPAIILLLSTGNSKCSSCIILNMLVDSLCKQYGKDRPVPDNGYIKAEHIQSRSSNEGKIYLEDSIENVANNGNYLVVFEDVDNFPVSSLSKLHDYVDHDNPIHKDMVYILTGVISRLEGKFEIGKYVDLMTIASNHFDEQWSGYEEEHRRALMSRIISVVGFINQPILRVEKEFGENICAEKCKY